MFRFVGKSASRVKRSSSSSSTAPRSKAARSPAAFPVEPLEARRMMSATLTAGQLNVKGTDYADYINVTLNSVTNKIRVTEQKLGTAVVKATEFVSALVSKIVVDANNGNDTVVIATNITKPTTLIGSNGNDTLVGGGGKDAIRGGANNDRLEGRGGNDVIEGGSGTDLVDFSGYGGNLSIKLDNLANDTGAGGTDNIKSDVENVNGGKGNDYIVGTAAANYLQGGGGHDTLCGLGGNDTLDGGVGGVAVYAQNTGNDYLYGGDGNDLLHASDYGNNRLFGEAGNDVMYGYGGADSVFGGSGSDFASGGVGNDYVSIGSGSGTGYGGAGNDTLVGGTSATGTTWLYGDAGNDSVYGYGWQNVLYGGDGDDYVSSSGSGTTWSYGGAGNDTMWGGYGANVLHGDAGNDTIKGWGAGFTNWIYGDDGDDKVYGNQTGNAFSPTTYVYGGNGNDQVFGGRTKDVLRGDAGNDTLVGIGGSNDTLYGGAGTDSFWCDQSPVDTIADASLVEILLGNLHRVAFFKNGASKELLGQNLADPTDSGTTVNLRARPLFASWGPTRDDIRQGGVGNCGTMAVMSAIADENPNRIRQSIVDLGDGTYAVQFGSSPRFVRVDADLPTFASGDGAQGSTWVRLMEKAFAVDRSNTFASTASRWMSDVFLDFGRSPTSIWSSSWSSGVGFLQQVKAQLDAGKAVTVSTPGSGISGSARLVANHAYHVISVSLTYTYIPLIGYIATGGTMVVRNPWGTDGVGSDGSNDGYVAISASQVMSNFVTIQSATA